jgi:hypothetical protein
MRSIKLFLVIFMLVALTGCSIYHMDFKDTASDFYPPKQSTAEIEYIENVNRAHEIVGVALVNTERRQFGDNVIEKLKLQAAKLGGDAITHIETDATGAWKKLPGGQGFLGNAYIRANFRAQVIAFK